MTMMSEGDLLDGAQIYNPGAQDIVGGTIPVRLPSTQRISRLSFDYGESGLKLDSNKQLVFEFGFENPSHIQFDIIGGDVGFPDILLIAEDGECYRFKRGNIKDFFDIQHKAATQNLRLPLSAFSYNRDMRTNAPHSFRFFEKRLVKIAFDFLTDPEREIEVTISNLRTEASARALPDVFSYVTASPVGRSEESPPFLGVQKSLAVRLDLKDVGLAAPAPVVIMIDGPDMGEPIVRILSDAPIYIELPMPRFGPAQFNLALTAAGEALAAGAIRAVRTWPRVETSRSKLGVSDSIGMVGIKRLGGRFTRSVLSLSTLVQDAQGYRFRLGEGLVEGMRHIRSEWYIAFKSMPAFLGKDVADYGRYGPKDMGAYEELMDWLLPKLAEAGVGACEVWNEANVIHEWCDDFKALVDMTRILKDIRDRRGLPLKLLSPSSTSWDFKYFERLHEAGVLEHVDGLAVHGYTYQPERLPDYLERMGVFARRIRQGGGLKVHITEVGMRTPTFSEHDQAEILSVLTIEVHFRPEYESVIWFRYENPLPENLSGYDQNRSTGYAMLGYGGIYARPMAAAYRFLDFVLSSLDSAERTVFDGGVMFSGQTGRGWFKVVIFNERLEARSNRLDGRVYDVYGNLLEREAGIGLRVFFCFENAL